MDDQACGAQTARWTMLLGLVAGLVLAGLVAPAPAAAHGDSGVDLDGVTLAPGDSVSSGVRLHYHRLVALVQADGAVVLSLLDESGAAVLDRGPAPSIRLNELVSCCDDQTWTPYEVVVHNPGDSPVTLDATIMLVHDDLAVMAFAAESGVRESVVALGALWTWVLWRAVRRSRRVPSLRSAVAGLAAAAVLTVGMAAVGSWRYESGGAPGVLAALGDVPILPLNPAVSRASLLVLLALLLWAWSGARWAASRQAAGQAAWVVTGAALLGAVLATAAAVAQAYALTGVVVGAAVAAGVPVLLVLVHGMLDSARTARPVPTPAP
jgi:hypothetical protein